MSIRTAELARRVSRLHSLRRDLDRQIGQARAVAAEGKRIAAEIDDLRHQVDVHDQVATLLTTIGEDRQAQAQTQIEALVTQGLRTIFGPDLSFHLSPVVRAKRPEVDFVVRSAIDGTVVDTDVIDARGGGLAAVVGFLLRLVIMLLSAQKQDTVLFLDETFAHVSAEYEPRLAEFLRELVDKTGVQVLMVTHSDAYSDAADVRYRFDLKDGATVVTAA